MSVLGLWILFSMLVCGIAYVIVPPPVQYYDYQYPPYVSQWQPLQSVDYQPNYYNSYYDNYYPTAYEYTGFNKPYHRPQKEFEHGMTYEEAQNFLQVYRLIRVIVLFRKWPKKYTLLNKLLEQLTKQSLQDQLVELVCHVDGYKDVAQLGQGTSEHWKLDSFVDDTARLLLAIQKALNALDLDDYEYEYDHNYRKGHGCCEVHEELCEELRQLRDQANALSVPLIKKHRVHEIKAMVKQALDSDILEDLDEELESRLLELDHLDLDHLDIEMPVITPRKEEQISGGHPEHQFIDQEVQRPKSHEERMPGGYREQTVRGYPEQMSGIYDQYDEQKMNELATALHAYFQQLSTPEPQQVHQIETVLTSTTNYWKAATTTMPTIATPVNSSISKEDKNSWFASLFKNGNVVPGTIDVSEPAVLMEPVTVEKDDLVFDIDQRIQAITSTEKPNSASAFFSAPSWFSKSPDSQNIENKESNPSFLNKVHEILLEEFVEHRQGTDNKTKGENEIVRELPEEQEYIDEDDDGPIRLDMFQLKETTPELDFVDPEKAPPSLESRDQLSPKSNARRAVKAEVLKVLHLLEEAFAELNGRISDLDVDTVVDGLRDLEAGIRWTEMLSAVQKLIAAKQLNSGEQILDVLEHWKEDENGQINNGYFERTYGGQTTKASVQ